MSVIGIETPWLPTTELAGEWVGHAGMSGVRVSYTVHGDGLTDGGRVAVHRGPCAQDEAHAVLWHLCPDTVVLDDDGALESARWLPSGCPEGVLAGEVSMRWPRCCGLRWRATGEGSAKVE